MAVSITTQNITDVNNMYVALFGRAPDGEGLGYWARELAGTETVAPKSLVSVADAMFAVEPARAYYPAALTNQQIVESFYLKVLGREADSVGSAYWTAALNKTGATPGSVIVDMVFAVTNWTPSGLPADAATDAAGTLSKTLFANKVAVSTYFGNTNSDSIPAAQAALNGVTADPASVVAAKAAIDNVVVPSQTFTLTDGVDTGPAFVGGAGDDVFVAQYSTTPAAIRLDTLTQFDQINGGGGNDTLVVTPGDAYGLINAAAASVSVSNIENVQFKMLGGLNVDAAGWTGVENIAVTSVAGNVRLESAAADSVTVNATGDVSVSDASVQTVHVDTAGDVTVVVSDAESVTIHDGGYGDIGVFASGSLGAVEVTQSSDGNVGVLAAGDIGSVSIQNSDGDVTVGAVGAIGSVSIQNSDGDIDLTGDSVGAVSITSNPAEDNDLVIETASNTEVNLTLEGFDGDIEIGSRVAGSGATVLNLTVNEVAADYYFVGNRDTMGSVLETINLTSSQNIELNTNTLVSSLTEIDASAVTGDVDLTAKVGEGSTLTVTTNEGDDSFYVASENFSDSSGDAISIDAGEGNNYIDTNTLGRLNVTAGAGNDELDAGVQSLEAANSSVDLGAGDNTLSLSYGDTTLSEGDINAFDTLPVTGQIGTINIWNGVVLSDDATLDVSAFDGEVHDLGFGDVEVNNSDEQASLTIVGADADLTITSADDFGQSDGVGTINLDAQGVVNLTIAASDEVGVLIDGSTTLASLTVSGDDIEAYVVNVDTGADVTVTSTDNDWIGLSLSDSALGVVTVTTHGAGDDSDAEVSLHGNLSADSITMTATYISDSAVSADAYLDIDDSGLSTINVGAVTVTADDEAELDIYENDDASITLGATALTSVDGNAAMYVHYNDNTNITLGAITLTGDNTGLFVEGNDASDEAVVINIGAVTQTSINADSDFIISGNDAFGNMGDLTINVASVSLDAADNYATFEIADNDDDAVDGNVEITVGAVSVTAESDDNALVNIDGNDLSTITLGNVTVSGGSDATLDIDNNDGANDTDRAYITVGTVDVTSTYDDASVYVGSNDWATVVIDDVTVTSNASDAGVFLGLNNDSTVTLGNITVTADEEALFVLVNNYCDSTIETGNVTLVAGEDALFTIQDNGDGFASDGSAIVGAVDITAASDATVYVGGNGEDYDVTLGDIDVVAGDDIDFDLINGVDFADIIGATDVTLTATAEAGGLSDVRVYMFDAADVATLTVNGTSDGFVDGDVGVNDVAVYIELDAVGDLDTIDLSGLGANSYTYLDLENANAATLDAVTIKVGEGDLLAYVDDANSTTVETFEFVGTDIGDVVIGRMTTFWNGSYDQDSVANRLNYNLDAVQDVLDVTALGLTSSELVFSIVDTNSADDDYDANDSILVDFISSSGVTGSILLVGLTNTDEAVELFRFAAA